MVKDRVMQSMVHRLVLVHQLLGREHLPGPTPPTGATTLRGGAVISSDNWWKQVFKTLQQFVIAETTEHVLRGLPLLNRVQTSLGVVGSGW